MHRFISESFMGEQLIRTSLPIFCSGKLVICYMGFKLLLLVHNYVMVAKEGKYSVPVPQ